MKKIILLLLIGFFSISLYGQTGPGGVGNSDGSGNLKLWLRADKNLQYNSLKEITEWVDNSGNNFIFTNSSVSPLFKGNALNALPVVNFWKNEAGLEASSIIGSDLFSENNNTIFFVINSTSGSYWFNWKPDASNEVSFRLESNKSVFNFNDIELTSTSDISGSYHILSTYTDGTNQQVFLNGTSDGSQANSTTLTTTLTDNVFLGSYDGTATDGWTGYIAEGIIYDRLLNSAERTLVENYLSAKYNITISNDYYSGDESAYGNYDFDIAGIGAEADGSSTIAFSNGVYLSENNSSLTAEDYIIIGHNNVSNSITTADVTGSVTHRWNLNWYFNKTGNVDAKISFDFSEGIDGGIPGLPENYVLLYRSDTTGDFSTVTVESQGIENEDQLYFNVADANITDGYYTIGTKDIINSPLDGNKTWYNYYVDNSDDWDNWARWTLDPDGTLLINPNKAIPGAADTVIVLNGSTVNINTDNKSAAVIEIRDGGILNISGTTTGHNFEIIKGEGRIVLAEDNYPITSDDYDFRTNGTIEFTGGGTTYSLSNLNTNKTFYNVVVNLDDPANTVILKSNLTVLNDFIIEQGIFQINDTEDNVKYLIDIGNDLIVQADGQVTTGTGNPISSNGYTYYTNMPAIGEFHKIYHELYIGGDFTNFGTAKFTNLTAPLYNDFATNGAVSVWFNGVGNNSVNLYGPAYFYNFIVDKGDSQSYVLTVYSENNSYFNLYGANRAGRLETAPFSPENPEVRKALFIKNGTLKLTGNIYIHSLSEGDNGSGNGDYTIGSNACLWIASANTTVFSTANDNTQAPSGAEGVRTESGYQGLSVYGKFRISNGYFGTHNASGIIFRGSADGTLQIEGGTVNISQLRSTSSESGKTNYIQSGGTLIVRGNKTEAGEVSDKYPIFGLINSTDNFIMSDGNIYIYDVANGTDFSNNEFYINSSDGNYSVTGGNITIEVDGGVDFDLYTTANLWNLDIKRYASTTGTLTTRLTNNLIISNDLSIYNNAQLDPSSDGGTTNFDLTIGKDFNIGFSSGSLAAYINRNNTTTFNGSGNSTITVSNDNPANYFSPYNFVISKDALDDTVKMAFNGTTANPIANVRNDFTITEGTFDYDSYEIEVQGDLDNSGVMGTGGATGRIVLNNSSAQQIIKTDMSDNTKYGHIELDNLNGAMLTGNNAWFEQFTLTKGILDIGNYRLTVNDNVINGSDFGNSKMIKLAGGHGARGLRLMLDDTYDSDTILVFPIGTDAGYSYAEITLPATTGNISGYLNIVAVNAPHPAYRNIGGCDNLDYYWKTAISNSLNNISGIDYTFYNPLVNPGGGAKKMYILSGETEWSLAGDYSNPLVYSNVGFATGDFTAGRTSCYNNVEIVYSTASGNWSDPIWTSTINTQDMVVIRSGHTVTMDGDNNDVASLTIYNGGVIDFVNTTNHDIPKIEGGGKVRISSTNIPNGDFEGFLLNDTAIFEYYGSGAYQIPTNFEYYPNLLISGSGTKTFPNQDIAVLKNLYIDGDTAILNPDYDLEVADSVIFDNAGVLQFPNSGTCNLTVGKTIDLSGSSAANSIIVEAEGTYADYHNIYVNDDIIMNNNAVVTLFNSKTEKAVDLYFKGSDNSQITSSTANLALNYLYVDKTLGTSELHIASNISLTDNTDRPITLTKGHLILGNSNINISLTSGDGNFTIPSDSKLSLRNGSIANITGTNTGLILNGALSVENNSQMLIDDGTNNNYIEYGSSGNSSISVSETATLTVGSQIRRKITTELGILNYSQTGGTVTVGNSDASVTSRGVFEILNPSSNFTFTGGELIIARGQSDSEPAVYLDPESSTVANGTKITFGNTNTPVGQNIGIYSAIDLSNIEVSDNGAAKTVKVYTLPLTIDSLLINTGQTFDANGNDIYLNGNFINDGLYTTGSNTTSFIGSEQKLRGTTSTIFNNLTIQTTDSVRLYNNITINGDLDIASGRLSDRTNTIFLKGDYNNNGFQYSQSTTMGGVEFNGDVRQNITGSGTFGLLNINNSLGVNLRNDFTVVDRNITLTNGSLYIRQYQLELGIDADIVVPSGTFNKNRMIVTNGAISDKGIKRAIPEGSPSDILLPVGVIGKYTPVSINNISTTGSGYAIVRAVDKAHPTALDPENVLQYYWNMETSGFSSFNAEIKFNYVENDVSVTGTNLESDYIPAYLFDASWSKFDSENVDVTNNIINFNFNTGANIDGDFTAGISEAIPDDVPVFYTISDGAWEDKTIWKREDGESPTSFPNGFIVKIYHDIVINYDLKSAYKTILETGGKLSVGTTIGHYFGQVSGTGHLSLETGRLPAGNYEDFFTCSGGTMEFGGTASYEIPDEGSTYRRLLFTGSGTKTLPSRDITICDTLLINGPTVNNKTHNNQITINGLFELQSGIFESGSVGNANATLIFSGSLPQNIVGDFTGTSKLNNITINNSAGLTLSGNATVANLMTLTSGNFNTTATDTLTLESAAKVSPNGGSSNSFIDGPMSKALADGSDFIFPIGNNTRYGKLELSSINTDGSTETWTAEYYDSNPDSHTPKLDTSSRETGLEMVSGNEFWRINGPAAGTAINQIRWDSYSILPAMTDDRATNLKMVEWITGSPDQWRIVTPATVNDVSINEGIIKSDNNLDLGGDHYFTLGTTESAPLPAAGFLTLDTTVCEGSTVSLRVQLEGDPDWTIYVWDGSNTNTYSTISSSPYSFDVTPGTTTTYTIDSVSDNTGITTGSTIFGEPVTVTVVPIPTAYNVTDGGSYCAGGSGVPVGLDGSEIGVDYELFVDGLPAGSIVAGDGGAISFGNQTTAGNYTVEATDASGTCSQPMNGSATVTINPLPAAILTVNSALDTICTGDNTEIEINFTAGTAPFGFTVRRTDEVSATNDENLTNISANPYTYIPASAPVWIDDGTPETEYTYTITTITDANGCTNTNQGNADVVVFKVPETGPQYHISNDWNQ
ncbi:MAG: hypothetical protein ACP5DQ_08250 [Bacteroidales bacterium]